MVIGMRLRNVKNKDEIMKSSPYLILNSKDYKGKWHEYFKNDHPIYIEVGMGKGDFIIENAIRYPDINFIGIEKFDSVIARALQKIPDGLPNLCMIRMDAIEIEEVFDHEIETLYLNFSDPWPKKRHTNRRLTSSVFLKRYDNLFKNDKVIIQKTDNQQLFEFSLVSLSEYGYTLQYVSLDYHHSGSEDIIMTEYERKFSEKGISICRLVAVKKMSN